MSLFVGGMAVGAALTWTGLAVLAYGNDPLRARRRHVRRARRNAGRVIRRMER